MRVPTEHERVLRCLLQDIHGPLNLLFPGIRVRMEEVPLGMYGMRGGYWELRFQVDYNHPKLGHLRYMQSVPEHVLADNRDSIIKYLMEVIPRQVLEGMLKKAQEFVTKNWYSL
ncbi:hypothetical protein [Pseudomonas phage MYY9]|uniref:Uncharacterized protein n=3 Tax=Phikmvvirus TaxID=477967 RepID=A0A7T7G0G4_9CAUD|nr:hypothetical protein AIIMSPaA1_031 [Pseudomonas phage AIIMS-Pa-A1]QQL99142.1 hypothetical protein [Pseudomonas phage MYY9]WOZ53254.1 hypothetical protein [Pseudomonas phage PA69]